MAEAPVFSAASGKRVERGQLVEWRVGGWKLTLVGPEEPPTFFEGNRMEIPYQQGTLFSALKILVQSCSRLADRFPASQAKAKIAPIWRPFFLSLPA